MLRRPLESIQFTSVRFTERLAEIGARPSIGTVINAVAESFWASLKRECVQGTVFATRADARRAIFKWTTWYNSTRQHPSLDYTSPINWEQTYRQAS